MVFLKKEDVLQKRGTEEEKAVEKFHEDINEKLEEYRDGKEIKIVIPDSISDISFNDIKTLLKEAGWEVRDNIAPGFGPMLYIK